MNSAPDINRVVIQISAEDGFIQRIQYLEQGILVEIPIR